MKKLLGILAVSAIGVAAWFSDVEKQDIPHVNILGGVNPGFENSTSKWTKTGSSTLAATTANVAYGVAAAEWDASATGEFLRSSDVAVPKGLEGRACLMEFEHWLTGGSAGDVVVRVETDGGDALTSDLSLAVNGKYAKAQLGFICPTADSIRIEFESTANASVLRVDQAYLGRDHRLGETIQSTDWVVATDADDKPTISNISATLSSSKYRRIGDTIDMITQFSVSGAATGNITITAPVNFPVNTTIANGGQVVGQIRGRDDNGGSTTIEYHGFLWVTGGNNFSARGPNGQDTWNATLPFTWASSDSIYVRWSYPVSSWAGSGTNNVTLETMGWFISGDIDGASPVLGATDDSGSFNEIKINGLSMTLHSGSATSGVKIPCQAAASTGLSCSGNESVGVVFPVPYAGAYEVCFTYQNFIDMTNAGDDLEQVFKVSETIDAGATQISGGNNISTSKAQIVNGAGFRWRRSYGHKTCEVFNFDSAGERAIRLLESSDVGGGGSVANFIDGGNSNISFTVYPITQNFPQAVALVDVERVYTVPESDIIDAGANANCLNTDALPEICCDSGSLSTRTLLQAIVTPENRWRVKLITSCINGANFSGRVITMSGFRWDGHQNVSCMSAADGNGSSNIPCFGYVDNGDNDILINSASASDSWFVNFEAEVEARPLWVPAGF